jgi:CBS domain-containing protein
MLKIKDVLQSKSSAIWSIEPDDTAYNAIELMAEKDIGALLVIDEGEVIGIFSERDYVRKVILQGKSSKDTPVKELMTADLYCINSDKAVEECMALMTKAHIRHMPVYENKKLAGIVTFGDIVNAVIISQKVKIQDLETYIKGCEAVEFDD